MTDHIRLTPGARRDRDRVLLWYEAEAPDQTERFIDDFYVTARDSETSHSQGWSFTAGFAE